MHLYLMQHGPALPKEEDPDEGLSSEGLRRIGESAQGIKRLGLDFDIILCSGKKRAYQTAAVLAKEIGFDSGRIVRSDALKAMNPVEDVLKLLSEYQNFKRILIAGHLPSLTLLSSYLLTGGDRLKISFDNGGCGFIITEDLNPGSGLLKWYVTAEQLKFVAH